MNTSALKRGDQGNPKPTDPDVHEPGYAPWGLYTCAPDIAGLKHLARMVGCTDVQLSCGRFYILENATVNSIRLLRLLIDLAISDQVVKSCQRDDVTRGSPHLRTAHSTLSALGKIMACNTSVAEYRHCMNNESLRFFESLFAVWKFDQKEGFSH